MRDGVPNSPPFLLKLSLTLWTAVASEARPALAASRQSAVAAARCRRTPKLWPVRLHRQLREVPHLLGLPQAPSGAAGSAGFQPAKARVSKRAGRFSGLPTGSLRYQTATDPSLMPPWNLPQCIPRLSVNSPDGRLVE